MPVLNGHLLLVVIPQSYADIVDMAHLARALANTFDQTNFEVKVNCFNVVTPILTIAVRDLIFEISLNPVTGNEHIVNINTNVYDQKYVINVKDLMGRIMKSVGGLHGENVIDMTDISNGIYLVEVMSGNDQCLPPK
ncbi:MAG: T9SS type A sorting domain-containing protein [Saprospiraceae bacterium]